MRDAEAHSPSRYRWLLPPVAVFLFAIALSSLGFILFNYHPFSAGNYHRWDSGHYVDIATEGYSLYRCGAPGAPATEVSDSRYWCGTVGWFPGYPWLIRGLSALGGTPRIDPAQLTTNDPRELPYRQLQARKLRATRVGVALSHLCFLGMLVLLAHWPRELPAETRWAVLLAAALFPGSIYYRAVFPVSLFLVLALGCLLAIERQRFGWAAALGALGAFTYSTGFLLAPVAFVGILLLAPRDRPRPWLAAFGVAGAIGLGLLAVFAVHQVTVGHWNAFFMVQERYGHGMHDPLTTLLAAGRSLIHPERPDQPANLQVLLLAAGLLAMFGWSAVAWRRGLLLPRERLALLMVAAFWLFPLVMGGGVSLTRQQSLLLPAVLLLPRLPAAGRSMLLVVLAFFSVYVTQLFLATLII